MMDSNNKNNLDVFSYHELLDRSYLVINLIESELKSHSVAINDNYINTELSKAIEHLHNIYQYVGKIRFNLTRNKV